MGIVVVSVVAVLVLAVVAYIAFVVLGARASSAAAEQPEESEEPTVETLRYAVPEGQDPVVVVSALRGAGYEPTTEPVEGTPTVVVPCPQGAERERERVREVIAGASETTLEGPGFDPGRVTFQDEKSG